VLRHEAVRANSEEPRPCAMSTQSWPIGVGEGPDESWTSRAPKEPIAAIGSLLRVLELDGSDHAEVSLPVLSRLGQGFPRRRP
jgi:hypothetical protein